MKLRRVPLTLGLLAVAAQVWALYSPGSAVPDLPLPIPGADKIVHALLFGVPVWLLLRANVRRLIVLPVALVHVAVSEIVQHRWIANRTGDVRDAAADLLGIGLGLWLASRAARGAAGAPGPHAGQPSVRAP